MKKGACGALFGLAITAAVARTMIRSRIIQRFALDDALLLFACVCLTVATGLLYKIVPKLYFYEELELNSTESLLLPVSDDVKGIVSLERIMDAYMLISWLVIFAVKFCFLSFFRGMIDRLKPMIIYWRVVVLLTAIFGAVSLCESFIACPRIGTSFG